MQILIITDYLPYPLISGDRIRVYNLIRRVARLHQVSLVAPLRKPEEVESVSHLKDFCFRVETGDLRRRSPLMHLPGLFRYGIAGKPPELKFLYSEELANRIRNLVSMIDFDIIQIEPSRMALYMESLPPSVNYSSILAFHNVVFDQYNRIFRILRAPISKMRAWLHSQIMQRWEPRYAQRFDRCIVVSEADRRLLVAANPHLRVDVIPNGVDIEMYQPLKLRGTQQPPTLLYIGTMSYPPSVDAVLFFCNQILPHIRRAIGKVQFWIVGADPPPEVTKLSGDGVVVTGRVQDVLPYYRQSSACIVPLRAGGGTRLKILEAMALGRPVISTTIGCEGLDVVDGRHILVADGPEQFARKIVNLLRDRAMYQRIVAEARQLVISKYSWDAIAKKLLTVYSEMKR